MRCCCAAGKNSVSGKSEKENVSACESPPRAPSISHSVIKIHIPASFLKYVCRYACRYVSGG